MQIRKASVEWACETARSKNPAAFDRIVTALDGPLDVTRGCWNWMKSTSGGYGSISVNGVYHKAHRLMFEFFKGLTEKGLCIRHICDNPKCCNPVHLYSGTHHENMMDRKNRGRGGNRKGSKNGRSKLSESDAIYIKNSTESPTLLAKRFGVSTVIVHGIKRNAKWKHLGELHAS